MVKQRSLKKKADQKQQVEEEIASLTERVVEVAPARGYAPPLHQTVAFRALPISQRTLRGLEDTKTPFTTMTAIQNACIPHALAGRDILGAARTGSGKTLAFIIPVLEDLFRNRFTPADGPGATILSPTRELAVQIFQVLKVAGKHHSFSVGLLIGGKKDFFEEQQHVGTTNIIIATPGRLLQHLEQTAYFDMSGLRILVLDEADRVLDMGFRDQLVHVLSYLPTERQTMLFSATQTRDVSDLATLSLNKPEYLGVHDKEKTSTPESLEQSYVVVPLEHKLNAIYSFVKTHLRSKSIIFMSSCSQVRHAWELFCSLRPGLPILALHGKLVQHKRTKVYFEFLQKPHAILFATDIAARGLDFPNVDWVVQADAPEDRDMYIHRAGRTARYRNGGKSLLILTPSEEKKGFVNLLQGKGGTSVPLKKLSINPTKTVVVTQRAASLVAANADLNRLAKKAFQSYVRCIYLMPLKDIFDVKDLALDGLSESLGLAAAPNIRFLKNSAQDRTEGREKKNVNRKLQKLKEQIKAEKLAKKLEKMGKVVPAASKKDNDQSGSDGDDSGDDLLVSKKKESWDVVDSEAEDLPDAGVDEVTQSRRPKKIRIEGTSASNKHVVFNDDGEVEDLKGFIGADGDVADKILKDKDELEKATDDYMSKVRDRLKANNELDKSEEKERVRQKHKKRRLKEKVARGEGSAQEERVVATLGGVEKREEDSDHSNTSVASSPDQSSSSDSSSDSDSDSSDGSEPDLKTQEEMALSLIRGIS
jgi:ATP-dependent RNA helicase DDX10/DBP4